MNDSWGFKQSLILSVQGGLQQHDQTKREARNFSLCRKASSYREVPENTHTHTDVCTRRWQLFISMSHKYPSVKTTWCWVLAAMILCRWKGRFISKCLTFNRFWCTWPERRKSASHIFNFVEILLHYVETFCSCTDLVSQVGNSYYRGENS